MKPSHSYLLRDIDRTLWERVVARAEGEGRPIRFVLLKLLRVYAEHGYRAVEAFSNGKRKR